MMNYSVDQDQLVATFSIIGYDPVTREHGIAVQSKFLSVGAVVPWAKANVGAIATQSWANTSFGPKGLSLLEAGFSPEQVVEILVKNDEARDLRQFAVIDAQGNTAAYTGKGCFNWAGHVNDRNFSCQGNILVSQDTVEAMADSFKNSEGRPLAERLITALDDGQNAGGDSRGKQSAAVLIVKENGGYGGYNDRALDIRVDDHPEPIKELQRLYELHQLYYPSGAARTNVKIEGDLLEEILLLLNKLGFWNGEKVDSYTAEVKESLKSYFLKENFDDRWFEEDIIDIKVLTYLRKHAEQSTIESVIK
jgi:uncharacterized Ntn-hydrolase superfamily protein